MKTRSLFASVFTFLLLSLPAFAYSGDIAINSSNITFSVSTFLEGQPTRIYATASNNSSKDLLGTVRFFDNGNQIGADQPVSLFANGTDGIFIDWIPSYGEHKIAVKIYAWENEIDDPSNNWNVTHVFAVQDTDFDGTPNETDEDDDGADVANAEGCCGPGGTAAR